MKAFRRRCVDCKFYGVPKTIFISNVFTSYNKLISEKTYTCKMSGRKYPSEEKHKKRFCLNFIRRETDFSSKKLAFWVLSSKMRSGIAIISLIVSILAFLKIIGLF